MTEKIQDTIQEISRKAVRIGEALRAERSKNEILQEEIDRNNEQLAVELAAVSSLKMEIESLKKEYFPEEESIFLVAMFYTGLR